MNEELRRRSKKAVADHFKILPKFFAGKTDKPEKDLD
jgi:hypothetical protein